MLTSACCYIHQCLPLNSGLSSDAYLWMLTFLSMSTFTNMQMLLCTFLPVHFLLLHGFLRCTQSQSAVSVPWGLFPVEWFGRIWLLPSLPWTWRRNTGCRRRGQLCGQGSPSNPPLSSHHKAGPVCYNKTDCETLSDQHITKNALPVTIRHTVSLVWDTFWSTHLEAGSFCYKTDTSC